MESLEKLITLCCAVNGIDMQQHHHFARSLKNECAQFTEIPLFLEFAEVLVIRVMGNVLIAQPLCMSLSGGHGDV